jgi:hypothetical protein
LRLLAGFGRSCATVEGDFGFVWIAGAAGHSSVRSRCGPVWRPGWPARYRSGRRVRTRSGMRAMPRQAARSSPPVGQMSRIHTTPSAGAVHNPAGVCHSIKRKRLGFGGGEGPAMQRCTPPRPLRASARPAPTRCPDHAAETAPQWRDPRRQGSTKAGPRWRRTHAGPSAMRQNLVATASNLRTLLLPFTSRVPS